MLSCPNKNSEEWKKILEEVNGVEEKARALWIERELDKDPDLNVDAPLEAAEKEDEDKFSKLVDSIKIYVNKKEAILKQKKFRNQKEKEYAAKNLKETIESAEGALSINIFVNDAYAKAIKANEVFKRMLAKKDTYSRQEMLEHLTAIADFASGYSILDEISKADVYEYFSTKVDDNLLENELTPQQKLSKAIEIRDKMKQKYVTEGIPLMADFLLGYKSDITEKTLAEVAALRVRIATVETSNATDEAKQKRIKEIQDRIDQLLGFSLDKKQMIELLTAANSDTGVLDYLISPLISSEDSALALFAKAIKSQLETARLEDIQVRDEFLPTFDAYVKSTGVGMDNPAKLNEGLYEEVVSYYKDKETGEKKEVRRGAFVQKYDISAYNKAQAEFFEALGPKPIITDESKESEKTKFLLWKQRVAAWLSRNTELKSPAEIKAIDDEKKQEVEDGIITPDEYDAWLLSNAYKKQISRPADKYLNPKWAALYDRTGNPKNDKGEYHRLLTTMYFEAQQKLPPGQQKGYLLPSIAKTDLERLQSNGLFNTIKTNVSEAFSVKAYDKEYQLAGLDEAGAKILPVHYTQSIDFKDVSLDLARSVLLFKSMANRFEAINEVNNEINLFQTIIGERKPFETNSKGQTIMDAFANKLGYTEYIRQNGEPYSKKHLDAFVDMIIYGEMQKAEDILGVSFSKITNTITGFSAITTIAADLLKGVANNLQGNIQLIIEANSSEFFSRKNLRVGKVFYTKSLPDILSDFGKSGTESLVGQLIERYDAMQGSFKDNYGNNITNTAAMRLFRTNTLFFNQHFGEHEIQTSTMLALMDATQVVDQKTGEVISLLEAHQRYGAKGGVEENTDFTENKRQDFQNRLHALNKRMHGVYNEFDRGTAQRYSLGRLAVMYRKHLVPGYKRRFKELSMDQELGSWTEGYYITFWNTFIRDLRDFKLNMIQNWSTYTPFQKAQIKRVIAEATIILTTTALIAILKGMIDDDDDELKNNYAYNFVLYELIRMRSETSAYISPKDAYRVVKSPSAMTGTLERAIKFSDQFFLTWDPEKLDYQRKQGVWNIGDNKSWAYFLKLMGYSGYNITPEVAVESFEGTLNK
jgi:hypothetical protein